MPKGEITEYQEVVCESEITEKLIKKVETALIAKGYQVDGNREKGILSRELKAVMFKYQQDNNLPLGQLSIATLVSLGISI